MDNKRPLIPKSLKRYKGTIYRNFTIFDLLIFFFWIILDIFVILMIDNLLLRLIIGLIILFIFPFIATPFGDEKIYQKIYKFIIFTFSKKKYQKDELKHLMPYEKIENNLIKMKNQNVIKVIELTGFNLFVLKENEKAMRIKEFQNFLLKHNNFSLYKVSLPLDYKEQLQNIKNIENQNKKSIFLNPVIALEKQNFDKLILNKNNFVTKYFVFMEGKNAEEVERYYQLIQNNFNDAFLNPQVVLQKDLVKIVNSFYKNQYSNMEPSMIQNILKDKIIFYPNHIKSGNLYQKIFMVNKLPKLAYDSWLSSLSQNKNVDWILTSKEMDKTKTIKHLDSVISQLRGASIVENKASKQAENQDYLNGLEELNESVNANGEIFLSIKIYIIIKAESKKKLESVSKEIKNLCLSSNIYLNSMIFLQKEAFACMLPFTKERKSFLPTNEISSLSLAYGFPFLNENHCDPMGLYLGYSKLSDRSIFFDPKKRDNSRKNSNIFILGTSGGGKSTTSKKLIKNLLLTGDKIFCLDPEREYKFLCKNLGGNWINFGSDRSLFEENKVINPLQFLQNESNQRDLLQEHLQFLEQFFLILFPTLDLKEISFLRKSLYKLYYQFRIDNFNSFQYRKNSDFPLLSDLFLLLKDELKNEQDHFNRSIWKTLIIYFSIFEPKCNSPESTMWNNHTNFNLDQNDLFVADLQTLFHSGNKRLGNAQMFLLMKLVNSLMVQNKIFKEKLKSKKHFALVIDEAHLLVDSEKPFALNFMYQFAKRARKYNAFIIITTQNVKDFIGSNKETKDKTSGIINSSQYGFILPMNPGDVSDLDKLLKASGGLMENEKNALTTGKKGQALFINGSNNRQIIQIDVSKEEFWLWEEEN